MALPARSLTPVLIVARYGVLGSRLLLGLKVAILFVASRVTTPVIDGPPKVRIVKVAVLIDVWSIASLKVAVMLLSIGTLATARKGAVKVTVGGGSVFPPLLSAQPKAKMGSSRATNHIHRLE